MTEMESHEGIVAEVNGNLLYFRFEDGAYVNVALSMSKNSCDDFSATLPVIGEKIRCENLHKHNEKLNDCPMYVMCGKFPAKFSKKNSHGFDVIWIIQDERLGVSDLFSLMKSNEISRENYNNFADVMLFSIETNSEKFSDKNNVETACCEYGNLPEIKFYTISRLLDMKTSENSFASDWSFAVHTVEFNEILIGFFYVNSATGTFFFKDKNRELPCVILKSDQEENLKKYFNRTLCVRKFRLIQEFYGNRTIITYLNFELKNATIHDPAIEKTTEIPENFTTLVRFDVLKKSHMCLSDVSEPYLWLLVQLKDSNERGFFRFSPKLAHDLRLCHEYTVRFNGDLRRLHDQDYARLDETLPQYAVPSHAVVTAVAKWNRPRRITALAQHVAGKKTSFRARLKKRFFREKLREDYGRYPGFGLIYRRQTLYFEIHNSGQDLRLDIDNWDRLATPLGLIDNALIDVRNVYIVNMTYCVTTPMTTFEVVKFL